jgi:two-component system nitrate/nitrite response regulator NarL
MKQRETVRILIADDFAEWRSRIRSLLETHPEWSVISEACAGAEAVQKTAELRPDIVILDIAIPRLNGIDAAKIIRHRSPSARVIFVSQIGDAEFRNATLAAVGAVGYVLKARAASDLQPAVEHALRVVTIPTQRPAVRPENLSP